MQSKKVMKTKGLFVPIVACVVFFLSGMIVSSMLFTSANNSSPKPANPTISFNVPQIPLPQGWQLKENLPGNSFATAFVLNTGIKTQGSLNANDAIDYYFFNLKSPSQVIVDITDVPKALYWILYDDQYREVAATYRTGTTGGSSQLSIQKPGKYYFKVWADYHQLTNYPYTIRLNLLPYFE